MSQYRSNTGQYTTILSFGGKQTPLLGEIRPPPLLGARVLRRGDGIIALPESRRKERLLAGRTKLASKLVKMEVLMRDYDPRLDTAIKRLL